MKEKPSPCFGMQSVNFLRYVLLWKELAKDTRHETILYNTKKTQGSFKFEDVNKLHVGNRAWNILKTTQQSSITQDNVGCENANKIHVLKVKGHCNTNKRHVWKQQKHDAHYENKPNLQLRAPRSYSKDIYGTPLKVSCCHLHCLQVLRPLKCCFGFLFVDVFQYLFSVFTFWFCHPQPDLLSSIPWEHPSHWSPIGRLFLWQTRWLAELVNKNANKNKHKGKPLQHENPASKNILTSWPSQRQYKIIFSISKFSDKICLLHTHWLNNDQQDAWFHMVVQQSWVGLPCETQIPETKQAERRKIVS